MTKYHESVRDARAKVKKIILDGFGIAAATQYVGDNYGFGQTFVKKVVNEMFVLRQIDNYNEATGLITLWPKEEKKENGNGQNNKGAATQ